MSNKTYMKIRLEISDFRRYFNQVRSCNKLNAGSKATTDRTTQNSTWNLHKTLKLLM